MTDTDRPAVEPPANGDRAGRSRRLAAVPLAAALPALALILGISGAILLGSLPFVDLGRHASPAADDLHRTIEALPRGAIVLLDMDADLGTYPEIRSATRAALADLLAVGARVAVISFSPEGRAIAAAEVARLRGAGIGADRLGDLGFRAGGDAALVQLAGNGVGPRASGPVADAIRAAGGGLNRFSLVIAVGGGDIGPRSWVEQVAPRVPGLRLAAITPTFLLPEAQPYRDAGQLVALEGTLPDDVAYARAVASGSAVAAEGTLPETGPSGPAMVLGMLAALGVLLGSAGQVIGRLRWPVVGQGRPG